MSTNNRRKGLSTEKLGKTLANFFPQPPEAISIEKLKSYPHLTSISDERAQELIEQLKELSYIIIAACSTKNEKR